MFAMTVQGSAQLERDLLKMERKMAKKVVRRAVRLGANIVKAEARVQAEANVGGDMGKLLSKKMQVSPYKRQRRGQYAMQLRLRPDVPEFVHTTQTGERQYIPHAIEYGHEGPGGNFVAPIPFLRPAVEGKRKAAENKIVREMANGVTLNG